MPPYPCGYGGVCLKKFLSFLLAVILLTTPALAVEPAPEDAISVGAPHAVLMEKSTGTLLYEKAAHDRCPPASVTKVMTMLLVVEAIEAGTIGLDTVVTASDTACSMGGSQIWLEPGERMTVSEMLKCVAVVSANDCAVALAELIAGSEEAFVQKMNRRAAELGMADTHFTNCTGLADDDGHYTSAYDIALMSRELIGHDMIKDYTTIWMDSIRGGEFELSNTNRLISGFEGATGLKTGFTSKAMYCLAATAERDGVEFIAVVLHGESSDARFQDARTLLNYGFANYRLTSLRPGQALPPVPVELGKADSVQPIYQGDEYILEQKGTGGELRYDVDLDESVTAPVAQGQKLGTLTVRRGETMLARVEIVSSEDVERLSLFFIYERLFGVLIGQKAD